MSSKGKSKNKFNERNSSSYKREIGKIDLKSGKRKRCIVLSLKQLDRTQGQSPDEWEQCQLLALAFIKLQGVCSLTRLEAVTQQIIKEYPSGEFPKNTDFTHPKHIPEDIAWCSLHIQGKECIIGYFEDNVFNLVFFDKDHRFWITEKKNT